MDAQPRSIEAKEHVTRWAWIALALFMLLYIFNALDRGLPSLMVDVIKRDLQITDLGMSLILGFAFALFYAVCGLPFGWLLDRVPRRLVLYCGVTVWSLSMMACGMANSFQQLFLARMALGVGEATLGPAAHSMIADLFPRKKLATALSIYTAGAVIGTGGTIAIGGLLAGYFTQYDTIDMPLFGAVRGWQALFILVGVPGLLAAFLVFTFPEPARTQHAGDAKAAVLWPFVRQPLFLCFVGSFAVYSMIIYGVNLWVASYMKREYGMNPDEAGPIVGIINVLCVGVGTIGSGWIVDRLVSKGQLDAYFKVFIAMLVIGAPFGIVAFLTTDYWIFISCLTLFKLMTFSYIGFGAATFQAVAPEGARGRVGAIYLLTLALVGNGGGPLLIAFFTETIFQDTAKLGWSIALAIALAAPIAILSATLGLRPLRAAVQRRILENG